MKIGFIGQGWVGKHYADDFEARGHDVVRYALEEPYVANKERVAECGIVFVAVPNGAILFPSDKTNENPSMNSILPLCTRPVKSPSVISAQVLIVFE